MIVPSTAEEKMAKKNDVKAISLLLMALPNEHQLTFDQYVDAQSMFAAIKARFGGNEAIRKTQKALLKQQYENFNASSSESLNSIFNRLQKLVSRLTILGVVTPPEDLNVKFLRSLPFEWDTHVVVRMNKPDFDTMGLDDLYNNFKIVEQKVKRSAGANNDDKNLAFLTTSGASSTKNINIVNPEVSTGNTENKKVEIGTTKHDEARKFYQITGRKIIIIWNSTAGYEKSKGRSSTSIKWDILQRIAKQPRSKRQQKNWNPSSSSKTKFRSGKTCALMAFSDSEVTNDKSCLKNYEALKKQYDDLLVKLDDTGFKASTYKRGLNLKRVKEEKEGFEFKIAKFEKSSKDLDQLLASQITDKSKKGFGYNVVPSPHPLILNRPTPLDLSYSGLEEFKQPEVNEYGPRDSSVKPTTGCDKESDNSKENTDDSLKQQQKTDSSSVKVDKDWKENFFCPANHVREEEPKKARENNDAPIIEDWVSDDEDDVEPIPKSSLNKDWPKKTVKNCKAFNNVRSVNTDRRFSTAEESNSQLNDKGFVDSGCSRHMTGNIAHLSDFKDFDGGYVTFGGGAYGGRITGTCTIKTGNLDFDDPTLSDLIFKLPDENQILLKIPKQDNMYSFDMKNIVPKDCLTCLVAKATSEESILWHRRLGHTNFKNINKLVKENLGLQTLEPEKYQENPLHIGFLENKPMIEGNGPKWLFDLDSLTQSMNYVPVVVGKSSNDFAGIQGVSESSTSSQQDQDWIVMPIWKDASYFGDASPKPVDDAQIEDKDELHDEDDATKESHDGSNLKENGTADPQVNTVRPDINNGSREVSTLLSLKLILLLLKTWRNVFQFKTTKGPDSVDLPKAGFRSLVQDGDADDVDEHLYRSMDRLFDVPYSNPVRYHVAVCDMCKFSGFSKVFSILLAADLLAKARKQNVVPTSTTKAELCQLQVDVDSSLDPKPSCLDNWYKLYEYHNMVAFLEKSTGSAGFHQVIDFLNRSHICYALTKKPAVSVSFIKQLRSAEASTDDNGEVKIIATIDGHSLSITEGSLRRHSN
ncbi:ribonuclease H-like domain-containing protein [Tanacetum coccineum]